MLLKITQKNNFQYLLNLTKKTIEKIHSIHKSYFVNNSLNKKRTIANVF